MPETTDPIKYILQGKELKNMTEDEWNALTSAYKTMTEAQGPLQAEYLKRQNNPNFSGYIPENEMSSISPQYQDAMSNWLTYAKKYGIGDPPLIGSSETTGSSTGAYGTQNAQYTDLLSPGNSPVSFERIEPTIPKINTRGYNVNPNVTMGQKVWDGRLGKYVPVTTEQTTLQGGVDPTDASIMYDEQGNLLQPTTGGAVGGSGESFVFPEAKDIINNAYGGRRKRNRYENGGPKFSLTSKNRPITAGSFVRSNLDTDFQDLEFANYSTNKNTLGFSTPLGNRPLSERGHKSNWYPHLNASLSLNNRQTRGGTPGTPNSAGLDVGYQIGDWESKPGIEGDLNFELQNQKQLRNRNFTTDNRVNLGAQYVNNTLQPYIGGDFGLDYTFSNKRREPIGSIGAGLNIRAPLRNTKGVDLGMSQSGKNITLGRDAGFDQIGSDVMRLNPYIQGNLNLGKRLGLSGSAGYNIFGKQPFYQAGLTYNLGDKMKKNKKYSHGGLPPHPEDFDIPNYYQSEVDDRAYSDPLNPYASNLSEENEIIAENTRGGRRGFNWPWGDRRNRKRTIKASFPYGGQPQQQGGQGGQGDQLQQIIMAYAQISNQDPQTIMQQLEQIPPEEQQQAIQQMAMAVQGGGQGNVPQRGMGGIGNVIKAFSSGFSKAGEGNKGDGQGVGNFVGGLFEGFGMEGIGSQFGGDSPTGSTSASTANMYDEHKKTSGDYDKEGNLIDTAQSSGSEFMQFGNAFKDMSGMGSDFMGGNLGGVGEGTLSEADWGNVNTQNNPNFKASPEGYQDYVGNVNPNYSPAVEGIGDKTNPMMQKFGSFLGGSGGEGGSGSGSGMGGVFNFAGGEGFDLSSILGLIGGEGEEGDKSKFQQLINDPKLQELIQQYGGNLGNQAYGGPRNPYACGGSKPMLPYKRAMGGPREDNTNVYRGATHEQGGIPIGYDYGGKVNPSKIEVEDNEVSWIDPNGGEEYIFSDRIEFKSGGKTKRKK